MPLNIDIVQILLHMLNFVILAGGLTLLLFKPVEKFLNERKAHYEELEKKIALETEENVRLNEEYSNKLTGAEETIARMQAEADKKTAQAAKETLDAANEKARSIIAAAEEEAEQRRKQILDSAQTEIGELVIEATQKLIGANEAPEQSKRLYDEFLKQAKTSGHK
ncbi:MAG: ATP synthase F0 subunit B [Lachnospiraceae bacterium]|nr:ATP synthase F0 subunit B [Lachnospiraceae bacterium]